MGLEHQTEGLRFHPAGLPAEWRMAGRGPGGTQEQPLPRAPSVRCCKNQAREDNGLGCHGPLGFREGDGWLPTAWTAEAEEAGLGREVAGASLANGDVLGAAPPRGRGLAGGALGAPLVPALRHPHRAPAPGPAHRAAPAPAAPRRPPARPGRSSPEHSSVQSGGCGAAARMGMALLGSPGWERGRALDSGSIQRGVAL